MLFNIVFFEVLFRYTFPTAVTSTKFVKLIPLYHTELCFHKDIVLFTNILQRIFITLVRFFNWSRLLQRQFCRVALYNRATF